MKYAWIRTEPGREPDVFADDVVPGAFGRKFDYWVTGATWERLDLDDPKDYERYAAAHYTPVAVVNDSLGLTTYLHEDTAHYAKPVRVVSLDDKTAPRVRIYRRGG